MKFRHKGKEKSYTYARNLSLSLSRNYPRKIFLRCFACITPEFDVELVRKFLVSMTVDNCSYQLIGREFDAECDETERWYGTRFQRDEVEEKLLAQWRQCGDDHAELHPPDVNPYIADDFSVYMSSRRGDDRKDGDDCDFPVVLREDKQSKI